jgi:hypothetical protein
MNKYISVNTKKIIFYRVIESILYYGWEFWEMDNKSKKQLFAQWIFGEELQGAELVKEKLWVQQ